VQTAEIERYLEIALYFLFSFRYPFAGKQRYCIHFSMLKHAIFLTPFSLAVFFQRRGSLILATIYLSILRYDEHNLHTEIAAQ